MDRVIIKNADLELKINPVGACIDDFTAYGIKIADKGITVGRYANRIAGSSFVLNGKEYKLIANEGRNILHGGPMGFSEKPWQVVSAGSDSAVFSIFSPDGDQGFPGNLKLTVSFSLADQTLTIDYDAVCDKDCFVNFTNHMYFNLNGTRELRSHRLFINSSKYTDVDRALIPTGRILDVENTKYDYSSERIYEGGLDTNFVLEGDGLKTAAVLKGMTSGLVLTCETTEPGVQVYDEAHQICLEAQHYPDSPHFESFPSTLLKAGKRFLSTTRYTVTKE